MEQKDLLLRYFEELGRVLASLDEYHEKGAFRKAIEIIDEAFTELINIPLSEIKKVNAEEFSVFLEQKELNLGQLNIIAELFFQLAQLEREEGKDSESIFSYKKALLTLEKVEQKEHSFSLDRNDRKDFIQTRLK